jgi:hypothetical protein
MTAKAPDGSLGLHHGPGRGRLRDRLLGTGLID